MVDDDFVKNLIEKLKTACPNDADELRREIVAVIGDDIKKSAHEAMAEYGQLNALRIAYLAARYNLDLKTTFMCLEGKAIPAGSYDNLIRIGMKVDSLMARVAKIRSMEK